MKIAEKQFDEAIVQAEGQSKTKLCLIEMVVPLMDAPEIVHKIRTTLEEMQKRK